MPLGIAPWQGDGNRGREEKEVSLDSGVGRAADGKGSSVCSSQALASSQGPGSHVVAPADPSLAALCKEQNLQHHPQ